MGKTSWTKAVTDEMRRRGDSWENFEECSPSIDILEKEFNANCGGPNGPPFSLWTTDWVYFPICYDGLEWAGSAPRNPNGGVIRHQGGGFVDDEDEYYA